MADSYFPGAGSAMASPAPVVSAPAGAKLFGMGVDPTRLLVLGATRLQQPATGYAIMRLLSGWGVQDWASVHPGSVYGALRSLVKDGLAAEEPGPGGKRGRNQTDSV